MDQKQAIADKLKTANNILVTVSNNPSVDQLSSCIGLALAFNKMGKHATAVFSGAVPSTIEFLQPEKTLEKTTDSLRDFIISLDKSKADKLRYKVEDKVVKIFITPYKTSISDKDLEFSQGDFNVDLVLALGVHAQAELDQAITAHGRILHDAAVATINVKPGANLGTMNWLEPHASSLCELSVELLDSVDKQVVDGQMATAFLTGIVAETQRFSNDRTYPLTMSISAELMNAGANQQLVATKLEPPKPVAPPPAPAPVAAAPVSAPAAPSPEPVALKNQPAVKSDNGTLEIAHDKPVLDPNAEPEEEDKSIPMPQINIDEHGSLSNLRDIPQAGAPNDQGSMLPQPASNSTAAPINTDPMHHMASQHMILQPPTMGGQLTANGAPDYSAEQEDDPLSTSPTNNMPLLSRDAAPASSPASPPSFAPAAGGPSIGPSLPPIMGTPDGTLDPAPAARNTPLPTDTLTQIEEDVNSPHLQSSAVMPGTPPALDAARDAVNQVTASMAGTGTQPPIQALNAQPLGAPLRDPAADNTAPSTAPPVPPPMMPPVV